MWLADSFWEGPAPFVFGACLFLFGHMLIQNCLESSFLRTGKAARFQQTLFNRLLKWRLLSPIILPGADVAKLTAMPLPKAFTLRTWTPGDTSACMEIYRLNAPDRFPTEVEKDFEERLTKDDRSMLVVEHDGRVIACGGQAQTKDEAWLCYGLIHPEYQRQGVGRLLLLSRLARFEVPPGICVRICAVAASIGYYQQFGFKQFGLWYSEDGKSHPLAGTSLHPEHLLKVTEFLEQEGYAPQPSLKS
jgi:GNAT superfamily N-acetyltransferase